MKSLYKNIFQYLDRATAGKDLVQRSESELHSILVCAIRELFNQYYVHPEESAIVAYCFTYGCNPDNIKSCLKKHRYAYKGIKDVDPSEWKKISDFCLGFSSIYTPKMLSEMVESWREGKWNQYKRHI